MTQALASNFTRTVGVDISPRMLDAATKANRYPQQVAYVCNEASHLGIFENAEFDFIVSNIVLQHLPHEIAIGYVREFFRVVAPSGILVFQLPSHHRRPVAMPDAAYRASLAVTAGAPGGPVRPSDPLRLQVQITNLSGIDWSRRAFGLIRVGNHWLDAENRSVARDDGRTSLPSVLRAGDTCELPLVVTAPADSGDFQCEIDLAQEGVRWFQGQEGPSTRFSVRVNGPADRSAAPSGAAPACSARSPRFRAPLTCVHQRSTYGH